MRAGIGCGVSAVRGVCMCDRGVGWVCWGGGEGMCVRVCA